MPTQRDIREKALNYIFAYTTVTDDDFSDETFWNIALEPEQKAIAKSSLKSLNHQLQALPKHVSALGELTHLVAPQLRTYDYKKEARELIAIAKVCSERLVELQQLKTYPIENITAFDPFFQNAKSTVSALRNLTTSLKGATTKIEQLLTLETTISHLIETFERVELISRPLDFPDEASIASLRKLHSEHEQIIAKATELSRGTVSSLEEYDPLIDELLTNYSQEQIGKVERNILRLATYEIKKQDLPKAIAITEALSLARKYTTNNAVPLINGVLDKL